jgi:MoxR-like ATPase
MSEAESAGGERSAQPPNSLEEQAIRGLTAAYQKMRQETGRVIIGQDEVVDQLLIAMFCRAHCLLVGVPGLAEDAALQHDCPDSAALVSSHPVYSGPDAIGHHGYGRAAGRSSDWPSFVSVHSGPLFTNVLLADEINRTPPKDSGGCSLKRCRRGM